MFRASCSFWCPRHAGKSGCKHTRNTSRNCGNYWVKLTCLTTVKGRMTSDVCFSRHLEPNGKSQDHGRLQVHISEQAEDCEKWRQAYDIWQDQQVCFVRCTAHTLPRIRTSLGRDSPVFQTFLSYAVDIALSTGTHQICTIEMRTGMPQW